MKKRRYMHTCARWICMLKNIKWINILKHYYAMTWNNSKIPKLPTLTFHKSLSYIISVVTVLLPNVILSKQRNVYIMQHMAAIKYIHNDLMYQSMADGCTEGCSVFVPPYTHLPFRDIIHSICFCWNVVFLLGHLKTTKFHIILKPFF